MDWDLTSYFDTFGSKQFANFKNEIAEQSSALDTALSTQLDSPLPDTIGFAACFEKWEVLSAKVSHLSSYISCLVAADASNEAWAAEEAALAILFARLSKIQNKALILIKRLRDADFKALAGQPSLEHAAYTLQRLREEASHRMSPLEEELAADLGIHGISAWSRLYFTTVSNLSFSYQHPDGDERTAPLSALNSLLASPERNLRQAVTTGSAKALQQNQHLFAAAINAISGTRLELNRRRGTPHFLNPGLFQASIQRDTLDALLGAIESRLPFAREVFKFRTSAMKIADPGWVDLRAALPIEGANPDWQTGVDLISSAFNRGYPAMGAFFDELIEKQWVDYSARSAKRPGGFCTTSLLSKESRIFMNYENTLNDVLTLAHEAGHAWHSRILRETRPLASRYPMTLAETASTFAERILTRGLLNNPEVDKTTQLLVLDAEIEHMLAFLLDLPIRFRFEEAVYQRRSKGQLSATELCQLMSETQHRFFGETFSENSPDPWFWASKMHFYIEKVQFYNYPYVFGYLLSQGFVEKVDREGTNAFAAFESFLKLSGSLSCEDVVAKTLGEDISKEAFWTRMIDGLAENFAAYKSLMAEQVAS
jgi:oligoendopeptidase F